MKRVKSIVFQLPDLTASDKKNNQLYFKLLSQLGNIKQYGKEKLESITRKSGLYPSTIITKSPINSPRISFTEGNDQNKTWWAGNLQIGFNLPTLKKESVKRIARKVKFLKDKAGQYIEIYSGKKAYHVLTPEQLFNRLDGKLLELNHSGVNFGPKLLSIPDYLKIKKKLAVTSNLYNYPTGEEWPFIIPSTDKEFKDDITDNTVNRNPKFELVHSKYHPIPLIQFDIETSLSKAKLLKLLPDPYGVSFPGLENNFRSVFIFTGWNNVILRFDLRFKSNRKYDFGYWLISRGGRIK
ncbi:hypothetical protein ACFLZ1_04555 [Patescibacteria group bacterium]